MDSIHPVSWTDEALLSECKWTFSRTQGPGGQHRNKVETSVHIEHLPSGLSAQASERRSQSENRKVALHRLRCRLAVELAPQPCDNQDILWSQYSRKGRIQIAELNRDFPTLLAILFERLHAHDFDDATVASELCTTRSQILKTLKQYPPALLRLNHQRTLRGLRSLV